MRQAEIAVLTVIIAVITGIAANLVLERIPIQQHRIAAIACGLVVAAIALQFLDQNVSSKSIPTTEKRIPPSVSAAPSGALPPTSYPEGAPTETPHPTSNPPSPTADFTVRRASASPGIKLRDGYGIDLDNLDSPNWGVTTQLPSGPKGLRSFGSPDTDIGWTEKSLVLIGDGAIEQTTPDHDMCAAETAYSGDDYVDLKPGDEFCVVTSQNRYASVRITKVTPDLLEFRTVVWDPPEG